MGYKYYKINKGYYFRYEPNINHFEILKDGYWENDESLISLFLDPLGDYGEITNESLIMSLEDRPKKEEKTK